MLWVRALMSIWIDFTNIRGVLLGYIHFRNIGRITWKINIYSGVVELLHFHIIIVRLEEGFEHSEQTHTIMDPFDKKIVDTNRNQISPKTTKLTVLSVRQRRAARMSRPKIRSHQRLAALAPTVVSPVVIRTAAILRRTMTSPWWRWGPTIIGDARVGKGRYSACAYLAVLVTVVWWWGQVAGALPTTKVEEETTAPSRVPACTWRPSLRRRTALPPLPTSSYYPPWGQVSGRRSACAPLMSTPCIITSIASGLFLFF